MPPESGVSYMLTVGEGYLLDTYGMKAVKLADLMNTLRTQFDKAEEEEDVDRKG